VRLTLALVLLLGCLQVMFVVLDNPLTQLRNQLALYEEAKQTLNPVIVDTLSQPVKITRVLMTVAVSPATIRAQYDLYLPAESQFVRALNEPDLANDLLSALLGQWMTGDRSDLTFTLSSIEYAARDQDAHLVFRTQQLKSNGFSMLEWTRPEFDLGQEILVWDLDFNTNGVGVSSSQATAESINANKSHFNLLAAQRNQVEFRIAQPTERTPAPPFSFAVLLVELPLFIPYAAVFLLSAAPHPLPAPFDRYSRGIGMFVGVQFLYVLLAAATRTPVLRLFPWSAVVTLLKLQPWWKIAIPAVPDFSTISLLMLLLGVILPDLALDTARETGWRVTRLRLPILVVLGLAGAVAVGFCLQFVYLWALIDLLIMASLVIAWILHELGARGIGLLFRSMVYASILPLGIGLVDFSSHWIGSSAKPVAHEVVGTVLFLAFGSLFVLGTLLYFWVLLAPAGHLRRTTWLGLTIVVALTLAYLFQGSSGIAEIWQLWDLANFIFRAGLFVLLAVMLRSLEAVSRRRAWPECSDFAIGAGMVLATFPYSNGYSWTAVVSVLLQYALLRHFLLVKPNPMAVRSTLRNRGAVLGSLIEWNDSEGALRKLRQGLLDKLAKGDINWLSFESKVAPLAAETERQKKRFAIGGRDIREFVLRFGPVGSAWSNGIRMAGFALLFSVPWMAIGFHNLLLSSRPSAHPAQFVVYAINIPLRWGIYGFLFGYFFAYWRGPNGVWKGMNFFLCVAIPQLIAIALENPSSNWKNNAFPAGELFILLAALGFCADLVVIVRSRRPWRDVLQVHGMAALSAWASAFLVAVGTAITVAATGQIPNLISLALKYAATVPLPTN